MAEDVSVGVRDELMGMNIRYDCKIQYFGSIRMNVL